MTFQQLFVSVVVPTYNRQAGVLRLLEALAGQTYPADRFEVVVVDDGSSDGTVAALQGRETSFRLTVLQQAVNGGPAVARNAGVARARGPLIVFLDDDVAPRPDLLEVHVRAHGESDEAVVIGPMLPPPDWPRPAWVRWEESILLGQYRDLTEGRYACGPRQFYTGNASLYRERFLGAGGFDARYKRAEDVELAYRMRDFGARFVFESRAAVLHYAWRSFESWSRTPYLYGRYDVQMEREKGHEALSCAFAEFHQRHRLTRSLVRLCLGRPALARGVVQGLRGVATGAGRLGAVGRGGAGERISALALSGAFNLLYWQGVADEMGGAGRVWPEIARAAPGAPSSTAVPSAT
jgi:GT2 family glycosyltransferase